MDHRTVELRLAGAAPLDRVEAWVAALGRVHAERRVLVLLDRPAGADAVADACAAAGVESGSGASEAGSVVVLARANDLPTPRSLERLVAAGGSGTVLETRVLPHGATLEEDGTTTGAPAGCLALPDLEPLAAARRATSVEDAAAAVRAAGADVRRLDTAAVLLAGDGPAPTADPQPYGHPAALPATPLHQLLVSTDLPTPALPPTLEPRPLLSVITRTQGTRLLCLEETLTCLAGQTSRDFELLLACHRVAPEQVDAVRGLLALFPEWLRERTVVLEVGREGRSAPLNDALDRAAGRYAVVLDDDDTVAPDWVSAFAEAESRGPGTVLRAVALAQDVRPVVGDPADGPAPVEVGAARRVWASGFSMVDHLWDNDSPFMTVAFPRGVFSDLGRLFDEELHTNEDWAYLVDAAAVAGVTSTPRATSTYRLWTDAEGSRDLHDDETWSAARAAVLDAIDRGPVLLPPGAAHAVRDLHERLATETEEKYRFAGLNEQAAADLVTVNEAVVALRARIAQLEERLERQRQRRRQQRDG